MLRQSALRPSKFTSTGITVLSLDFSTMVIEAASPTSGFEFLSRFETYGLNTSALRSTTFFMFLWFNSENACIKPIKNPEHP